MTDKAECAPTPSATGPTKETAANVTTGDTISGTTKKCNDPCVRADEIVKSYQDMIASARKKGYNVAADNLQHWLNGSGASKTISSAWLRGFDAIREAERTNQERFEGRITSLAYSLKDGETRTFQDYWDRLIEASKFTELYYASGTSTLRSSGTFTLTRTGQSINIAGTVSHHWHDPYDWHPGLAAFIPGFGSIPDEDAKIVESCKGAKEYEMVSDWQQSLKATMQIINWWPDSIKFTWTP